MFGRLQSVTCPELHSIRYIHSTCQPDIEKDGQDRVVNWGCIDPRIIRFDLKSSHIILKPTLNQSKIKLQ
jgi:hypothetical protein